MTYSLLYGWCKLTDVYNIYIYIYKEEPPNEWLIYVQVPTGCQGRAIDATWLKLFIIIISRALDGSTHIRNISPLYLIGSEVFQPSLKIQIQNRNSASGLKFKYKPSHLFESYQCKWAPHVYVLTSVLNFFCLYITQPACVSNKSLFYGSVGTNYYDLRISSGHTMLTFIRGAILVMVLRVYPHKT